MSTEVLVSPEETSERIVGRAREFVVLSEQIKDLTERRAALREELSEIVDTVGETDGNGHRFLALPNAIGGFSGFQRQRRVSRSLDEDAAHRVLRSKDLQTRCFRLVETLDEDEVMGALAEGLLTEQDIDEMFPPKVTFAFVPVK